MKKKGSKPKIYTVLIIAVSVLGVVLISFNSLTLFRINSVLRSDYENLKNYGIEKGFYTTKILIETLNIIHTSQYHSTLISEQLPGLKRRILSYLNLYNLAEDTNFLSSLSSEYSYYTTRLLEHEQLFRESLYNLLAQIDSDLSKNDQPVYEFQEVTYDSVIEPFLDEARLFNNTLLQVAMFSFDEIHISTDKAGELILTAFIGSTFILLSVIALILLTRSSENQYTRTIIKSKQNLAKIFNAMLNAYALHELIIDEAGQPVDYRFLDINPAFTLMTGLTKEQVIGNTVKSVIPDLEEDWILRYAEVALHGKEIRFSQYSEALKRHYFVQAYSPEYLKFTTIFQDITEREEMIGNLKKARDLAEQGNETKRQFLANISHEMRTPLNGILGMANLLELTNLDEDQRSLLAMLSSAADNMFSIVRNLLSFNQYSSNDFKLIEKPISLHDFVDNLHQMAGREAARKGLDFEYNTNFQINRIIIDSNQLFQVLWNILDNAVKYTDQGKIIFSAYTDDILHFHIEDTGPGIPGNIQEHMFDLFYQGEDTYTKSHQGMGMGLANVKIILNHMNGVIEYSRSAAGGSVFTLAVPFRKVEAVETIQQYTNTDKPSEMRKIAHIDPLLIAEDEVVNRIYLKHILEDQGFTVLEAKNGQIAVETAAAQAVSCILMDIGMPVMNGLDAAIAIRAQSANNNLPIIAVTAYGSEKDKQKMLSAGINEILQKPVDEKELFALLESFLGIKLPDS